MRSRATVAVVLAAAVTGGAAVAAAAELSGRDGGASQLDPALQARFAAFRRPALESDRLPATAQLAVERGPQADLGAEPGDSRRAATLADGSGLFLVPAEHALCLAADIGTVFCNDADSAGSGLLAGVTLLEADRLRATGVAPDGTSRVAVELGDGATVEAVVGEGAWHVELPAGAEPVAAVVEADGRRTTIGLASPR
jgi:hypothetical protein